MISNNRKDCYRKIKRLALRHGVDASVYCTLGDEGIHNTGVSEEVVLCCESDYEQGSDSVLEIVSFDVKISAPKDTTMTGLLQYAKDIRRMVRVAQALNAEGVMIHHKKKVKV